jgi:hypothetical protein
VSRGHELSQDDTAAQQNRWKKWAKYVGGVVVGVIVIAGTVAVTLVLTRKSAQRENLIAFLRGQGDGLKQGGWLDGWTAAEEWYAEHGVEELLEALAEESYA